MATVKHFPILTTDKSYPKEFFKCPNILNDNQEIKKHTFKNGVSCLIIEGIIDDEDFQKQYDTMTKDIQTVDVDDNFDFIMQSNELLNQTIAVFLKF